MNKRTTFQTREGVLISRSNDAPIFGKAYALKKAIALGHGSLIAYDSEDDRTIDYTNHLQNRLKTLPTL